MSVQLMEEQQLMAIDAPTERGSPLVAVVEDALTTRSVKAHTKLFS